MQYRLTGAHCRLHALARILLAALLLVLPGFESACAGPGDSAGSPPESAVLGSSASPITGGTSSTGEYPAVGKLTYHLAGEDVSLCTATLVDSTTIVTAAHCLVRFDDSARKCEPRLLHSVVFHVDGKSYGLDMPHRRVYVPGQTWDQLTGGDAYGSDGNGGCKGGALYEKYYNARPWGDIAVAGLDVSFGQPPPSVAPMGLSKALPQDVPAHPAGTFTWIGNRDVDSQLKYQDDGLDFMPTRSDVCDFSFAPGGFPFFSSLRACDAGGAGIMLLRGLLYPGDSGGPLVGPDGLTAGVASSYAKASEAGCDWTLSSDVECEAGQTAFNVWSAVASNLKFVQQAIAFSETDWDQDYVPNDIDSCPDAPNAGQDNSNHDYEEAHGTQSPIGDACDPEPVAKLWPGSSGIVFGPEAYKCRPGGSAQFLEECAARERHDEWNGWTAWSSDDPGDTTSANTTLRYCVCRNDATGENIIDKAICAQRGCVVDNRQLHRTEGTDPQDPTLTRWLRMSMYSSVDPVTGLPAGQAWEPEDGESITYRATTGFIPSGTGARVYWDWTADAQKWHTNSFWTDLVYSVSPSAPGAPAPQFPPGPDIAGMVWTHNDSVAGSFAHTGQICSAVDTACGFGNNYTFENPSRRTFACPMLPVDPFDIGNGVTTMSATVAGDVNELPVEQRFLHERSIVLDIPLVSQASAYTTLPFDRTRIGDLLVHPGMALPCGASGDGIAELSISGHTLQDISHAFSPTLRSLLRSGSDLLWVGPSDPIELGGGHSAPLALGLSSSGGIVQTIRPSSDGRLDLGEREARAVGEIAMAQPPAAPAALGPSAYSRVRGELVQLVGTVPGAPLDTLRVTSLNGTNTEIGIEPVADRPMTARAAALTFKDRRLWMVGTVASRAHETVLMVIDVDTGRIEQLRPLLPSLSRFWLTTSAAGEVVLVTAHKDVPWYYVAVLEAQRYDLPARIRLSALSMQNGRIIGAPRVSSDALLVPVGKIALGPRKRRLDPANYHVEALPLMGLRSGIHGQCFQGAAP